MELTNGVSSKVIRYRNELLAKPAIAAMHGPHSLVGSVFRSASVVKLVSVLFGKRTTTLVVTKC